MRGLMFAGVLAAAVTFAAPPPAAAAMSEKQVRDRVTSTYNVRVLKVRRGSIAGKQVFLVTVMNRGGNFNEAVQVTTLAFDVVSGAPVPGFRHRPSGSVGNQAPRFETNRQPVDTLSQGRTWR